MSRLTNVFEYCLRSSILEAISYSDLDWLFLKKNYANYDYFKSASTKCSLSGTYLFCDNKKYDGMKTALTILKDRIVYGHDIIDEEAFDDFGIDVNYQDKYPVGLDGFFPVVNASYLHHLLENGNNDDGWTIEPERQIKSLNSVPVVIVRAIEDVWDDPKKLSFLWKLAKDREHSSKLTIFVRSFSTKDYSLFQEKVKYIDFVTGNESFYFEKHFPDQREEKRVAKEVAISEERKKDLKFLKKLEVIDKEDANFDPPLVGFMKMVGALGVFGMIFGGKGRSSRKSSPIKSDDDD